MRFVILFLFVLSAVNAQESLPFFEEVKEVQQRVSQNWNNAEETIVFTGSSSIRLWEDLQDRFPDKQILNTGFGGSQSSDLELYMDELILDYSPNKVFIYEGDNDISSKRRPKAIIGTFVNILEYLQEKRPGMEIVLISAKPSISRWHLKRKYLRLNKKLKKLAATLPHVHFVDVWTIMLNKRKLKRNLFIEDGLHMNTKGYDLWYAVLKEYVNNSNNQL